MNGLVQFHIAEEIETGNLVLVSSKGRDADQTQLTKNEALTLTANNRCQPRILFSPPGKDLLYQNITTSREILRNAHGVVLWVAIIWRDRRTVCQATRSVLYLYKLCQDTFLKFFRHAKDFVDVETPQIQGRRVQSLPSTIGGIHPYSPLWSLHSCPIPTSFRSQSALSGFQLPPTSSASTGRRYAQLAGIAIDHHRCFVWGARRAEAPCEEIVCKIYDFSYDYLKCVGRSASKARAYTLDYCACALHDTAFDFILPDITRNKPDPRSRGSSHKSIFPGRPRVVEKPTEDVGTVIEIASPERHRALDRVRDWQLEKVKSMRRA